MKKRVISIAFLFGCWFLLVAQSSCEQKENSEGPSVSFVLANGDSARFQVEIAQTPEERARGLMFRKELSKEHGMLFIFDRPGQHSFYMKNTYIPLDIVFLDRLGLRARVVGVLHDMKPLDESSRSIKASSLAAVEIYGGLAKELGIETGTEVRFHNPR